MIIEKNSIFPLLIPDQATEHGFFSSSNEENRDAKKMPGPIRFSEPRIVSNDEISVMALRHKAI
jgi:hypothetical protein